MVYTPELFFDGDDSFTFMVNDGLLDSNIATVSITVNNCLFNLSTADALEVCDFDDNGFGVFDLTVAEAQIFDGVDIGDTTPDELVGEFIHEVTSAAQETFETEVGQNYRLEISGEVFVGAGAGIDAAYLTSTGLPRAPTCDDSIYTSLYCDDPNLRPTPDEYDPENHTYNYYFTADSASIYVGFMDFGPFSDNSGTITFRLFKVFGDYTISYHPTSNDAQNNSNQISDPTSYTNILLILMKFTCEYKL